MICNLPTSSQEEQAAEGQKIDCREKSKITVMSGMAECVQLSICLFQAERR